jgi:hypothetical protein
MAWTTADLATVEAALATGALRVRYADGREVTYQSATELLKVRATIAGVVSTSRPPRSTLVRFDRGY